MIFNYQREFTVQVTEEFLHFLDSDALQLEVHTVSYHILMTDLG